MKSLLHLVLLFVMIKGIIPFHNLNKELTSRVLMKKQKDLTHAGNLKKDYITNHYVHDKVNSNSNNFSNKDDPIIKHVNVIKAIQLPENFVLPINAKKEIRNFNSQGTSITQESIQFSQKLINANQIQLAEVVNLKEITQDCVDLGCEWCDIGTKSLCKKCREGFFEFNSNCYTVCPKKFVAEVKNRKCVPLNSNNVLSQISFVKLYTQGSCDNLCGKITIDCSCEPNCITNGNCCSDYNRCEVLINMNYGRQAECYTSNPNCDLCQNFEKETDPHNENAMLPYTCGQCREGLFKRNDQCVQACHSDDSISSLNRVCVPKIECLVHNCSQCMPDNKTVCRTCTNGTYLYNNQCLESCPYRLRADRISWTCLEPPVFAWYWVFPSRSSCRRNCGRHIGNEMDCSCRDICFGEGNCCQDIEDYCPQYIYWK